MVGDEQRSLTQKVLTQQSDDTFSTQKHAHASQDSIHIPLLAWGKLMNIERPAETHMIAQDRFRIGRTPDCDMCIANSKISATHCEIFQTPYDGRLSGAIRDQSTNGTFLNARKLIKDRVYKLRHGDEIKFVQGRKKRPRLRSDTDVSSSNSESFGGFVFFELESNLPLEDVDAVDNPRRDTIPGSTTNGRRTSKGKVQREPIRFQKGELIGAGGFGQVFLGMDLANGKLIAVKHIDCNYLSSESEIKALKEEIELLRTLSHPRIVHYLGVSVTQERFCILLEYVPGGSIQSLLLKFGKFEDSVISAYTDQLLQGLEYLHSCGVIHRDIKAANVLVSDKGDIKVADFGASYKKSSGSADASKLWGTPLWMAPESVRSNAYSPASDIWSLGCTVLEMATAATPWAEKQFPNPVAALFHIGRCTEPPLIPMEISESPKDFIQQCLQMDPARRPMIKQLLQHPLISNKGESANLGASSDDANTFCWSQIGSPAKAVEVRRDGHETKGATIFRLADTDIVGSGEYVSHHEDAAQQLSQHCSFLQQRASQMAESCFFGVGDDRGNDNIITAALQEVDEWLQEDPSPEPKAQPDTELPAETLSKSTSETMMGFSQDSGASDTEELWPGQAPAS
eukprot:CAMPEP_0174306020 /NCGR_PEP_ID=MMETSP0810-20121108/179_1 /TAXON_ID=73025 ORGANISM="Eutreptiella gymnastica-like, Strain CCMP1594" /NCGR_SAMPLE_ID=MMETSP0810 /ASSEMBLY_ACC=CAM_ASM_000659 /LENGTH=626 /DNA_ID=CAMNT_0015412609 /DNA_START=29 /DNA_END=1909 /DNA_ORIENTATION=+